MNRNIVTVSDAMRLRALAHGSTLVPSPERNSTLGPGTATAGPEAILGGGAATDARPDRWFERLTKYIPAEALSLYLVLVGIVPTASVQRTGALEWLAAILVVCIVFNVLYLALIWKIDRALQIVISSIALVTYVFASGGTIVRDLAFYEPWKGTLALTIVTAFLTFVEPPGTVKPETPEPTHSGI